MKFGTNFVEEKREEIRLRRKEENEELKVLGDLKRLCDDPDWEKPKGIFRKSCPNCGERLSVRWHKGSIPSLNWYKHWECKCGYEYVKFHDQSM